ncbi:MAG TPA: hypothetical protein PKW66_10395 [Polyangiaceae bacterium]|nr:hypothetical protein [Polyangiaceae bacterium]
MRISELEARDPSLGRSIRTALSEGWSAQYGKEIRVVDKRESGQLWRAQRLLSAYFQVVRASLFANSSLISSDILPGLRGCPSNTSWALL